MKLASPEQIAGHTNATRRGALEGTVVAGSVATLGSMWATRRYTYFRQLPPSLKLLGILLVTAPGLTIQAERRGLEYDKSQWEGDGMQVIQAQEAQETTEWESMSTGDKIGAWASRHEYSIIIAGWALSLAAAGGIISRNPYQSTSQKIVQARMWAQGLSVGMIIAAAAFKTNRNLGEKASRPSADHSWMDIVAQQQQQQESRLALEALEAHRAKARALH
ncbi:hypothetical protein FB45DRAFT_938750 [Roridomyces roridus]|uniref:HIG1 domain-containing protein n=1 Tax=Roridomyces roridus TaxID=1738132 RepID=A0AAD7B7Z6_9AGAR|nr:hypothetical protein FB45DRAFT_938750 [Roridomyces roridus]